METFLAWVTVGAYFAAAFAVFIAFSGHGTDIQLILAGVFATCGTVAAAGYGIMARLEKMAQGSQAPPGTSI